MERTLDRPLRQRDKVTATERIDGIECLIVLEQDMFGRYREARVDPLHKPTSSADEDVVWPGFLDDGVYWRADATARGG